MELFKSRTRVAYTNAVGDKVYPVIVDIKRGIKSTEDIQFVSSDVNTGILSVAFISGNENFNVNGADVVCSVMRPDASTLELPCEVVRENIVEVPLGINGTSQDGVYSFDFKVLKGGNKIVGTPIMNYSVSLSIGNDMVVEEDDRLPVLTMLITRVNELKDETSDTINQANVATEASKVATANAIEATNNANAVSERVSQETATAISEIQRDTENAIASMNQSTTDAITNMNQSATDAIADMTQKTNEAVTRVNDNLANINTKVDTKISEIEVAKSDMTNTVSNKVSEVENRFNALTSKQQQDAEVIDARDGETSLKARLDRDVEKTKQVYVNVEGSHISTDSSSGYAKDVEILGNTIQSASNLADIRSVGDKIEGQELYEIPVLSVGKNLLKDSLIRDFTKYTFNEVYKSIGFKVEKGKSYIVSLKLIDSFSKDDIINTYFSVSDYCNPASPTQPNYHHLINGSKYIPQTTPITSKDGYIYLCVFNQTGNTKDIFDKLMKNIEYIQLEEGTQATPYEPYQEDKLTILSLVQLEKVGDVADRIIEKNGVCGIEKNVGELKLENLDKVSITTTDTTYRVYLGIGLNIKTPCNYGFGTSLCNMLPFVQGEYYTRDEEHYYLEDIGAIFLFIDKSKFDGTKEGLNKYLEGKGYVIKYQLATPQFIPLPHSQQIKLRTFANKTNISFLTEIEGAIKAQVPKSIGATVNTHTEQISNLNKELDIVKKLEESTVSTVTTESDFTTVEATSNGYFEDVKLEGKTLVNLVQNAKEHTLTRESVESGFAQVECDTYILDKNKDYTAIYIQISREGNTPKFSINNVETDNADYYNIALFDTSTTGYEVVIKKINRSYNWQTMRFYYDSEYIGTTKFKLLLLEGDHTQNPPNGYIEGLKSVGDGVDEISVESCYNVANIATEGDTNFDVAHIKKGITYSMSSKRSKDFGYNLILKPIDGGKQKVLVSGAHKDFTTFVSDVEGILHFNSYEGMDVSEIMILPSLYTEDTMPKFKPYSPDKKRLLYYNNETQSWEKPILREWDSIEKHANGKYYYHQRSLEAYFDGDENWGEFPKPFENTMAFQLHMPLVKHTTDVGIVADKIQGVSYLKVNSEDVEGISLWDSQSFIRFRINKSKLPTQDVAGFKQWLQANNVTVVYQLAQEKVYECTNIDLITYANETNYIVNCGAIAPKTTLKVHNNISNVVKILQQKVSLLENKFIEGLKQVLAGDMYSLAELLYPEDFEEVETENNIMLLPLE